MNARPLVLAALLCVATTLDAQQQEWSVLIRGGTIVDGTGAPRYAGDVALIGDRIAVVSRTPLDPARATRVIDATGLICSSRVSRGCSTARTIRHSRY
jgi:adenine deaminase